jgi:acyl-ACP--UDP-N-acetylglucosamine O-acyltransferase
MQGDVPVLMDVVMASVHPTAVVDSRAELASDVVVGPFVVIDGPVRIGAGSVIGPHVHILGETIIGERNRFHAGCVIGDLPQHLAYKNEPTRTIIGDDNVFRECFTVHRGMPVGEHCTRIGSHNLFMVNTHIAHDCVVGNHVTMANALQDRGSGLFIREHGRPSELPHRHDGNDRRDNLHQPGPLPVLDLPGPDQ